jgi:hypothetical protein
MIDAESEHRLRLLAADGAEDLTIAVWFYNASERTTQDKLRLLATYEAALPWQDGVRWLEASQGGPQASKSDRPTHRHD